MKRVLILGALLTAILAVPASAQTLRALSFGLGGLTLGQTARLNVAIPGEPITPKTPSG